jgi:hypothetical protein
MNLLRIVAVSLLILGPRHLYAQTVCRSADSTSVALIEELGRYSSATSGGDLVMRDTLHLVSTPANQLVLITNETACRKANSAYQTAVTSDGGGGLSGRVYVVQVGTRYAVLDPTYNAGDPTWSVLIFDSKFKLVGYY